MTLEDIRRRANELCKELTSNLYIISLQNREVSKCEDILRWAHIMQTPQYYLVKSHVGSRSQITTQFTGIDKGNYDAKGRILIFETTVFGWDYDGYLPCYATWDDAEKGHFEFVEKVHAAYYEKKHE